MRWREISEGKQTPAEEFVRRITTWDTKYGYTADLQVEDEREVFIEYISGSGFGLVDKLCSEADALGVKLTLCVEVYAEDDGGRLVPYYQSKGFRVNHFSHGHLADENREFDLNLITPDFDRETIGMERDPHASLHEKAALSSHSFAKWFSGSKVVDEHGEPLLCYHGTLNTFDEFRSGSHFGDRTAAVSRIEHKKKEGYRNSGHAGLVYPVYLSIKNPLRIEDDGGLRDGWDFTRAAEAAGAISPEERKQLDDHHSWVIVRRRLFALLEERGFDGLVYRNTVEGNGLSWVIFHPWQVRHAMVTETVLTESETRANRVRMTMIRRAEQMGITADIAVSEDGVISLENVNVPADKRRQRLASIFVMELCEMCDTLSVTCWVYPHPYEQNISPDELRMFYQRFGFEYEDGDDGYMVRYP